MYRSGGSGVMIALSSVWSHKAIACCVFVQPPSYTMPSVSFIVVGKSVVSCDATAALVENSTTEKRTVEELALLSISALKSLMNVVAKLFVLVLNLGQPVQTPVSNGSKQARLNVPEQS